jgi:hypothetical protein
MPLRHERFTKPAGSIPLLRADDCFPRFHTARVKTGGSVRADVMTAFHPLAVDRVASSMHHPHPNPPPSRQGNRIWRDCCLSLLCHSRGSGNPVPQNPSFALDSRFRGNDGNRDVGESKCDCPAHQGGGRIEAPVGVHVVLGARKQSSIPEPQPATDLGQDSRDMSAPHSSPPPRWWRARVGVMSAGRR